MRSIRLLPLVLVLACGDNDKGDRPDAGKPIDAPIDAPVPLTCAYNEQADATNDDLFGPMSNMPEATGIEFTGTPKMICGKLDNTHYQQQATRVDIDSYQFSVPAASTGIAYLIAPGAEILDTVFFDLYDDQNRVSETGEFVGNFAVVSADLPPGNYTVAISSYHAAAPATPVDYKLIVQTDPPSRCAKATAAPNYTEELEGDGGGNDVFEVRYGQNSSRNVTALATDVVEPTGISVTASSFRVSGKNETFTNTPASWADSFMDRDAYQITMGAGINQLSVRLNWPGNTADLDFLVFPMAFPVEVAAGWYGSNMEDEFTTMAVIPGMSYWIWVGAIDSSTGQPIDYDLTLCGASFTPPPTM